MRSLVILVCLAPLYAQVNPEADRPSVRVHGESQVSAEPDEAEIDVGVVTQGATSDVASTLNTQRVNAVVQSLRSLLPSANIKTINFSINPNFRYPKEGAPTISGYTADNTVRLIVDDINVLRKVIDTALKAGASSVNRLNFTMRSQSEKDIRAQALGEAASQAATSAKALAASLKLKLGRILRVEEGQPIVISPAPQIDLGRAQSSDMTPLSPGYIQVHANVNLTYELIQ
ncbi:MAG: SIMPL domain-containing protein [Acidobacteriota bacterium]|nr:SIMPL domain-containing protein [Acidobacteriota bacterium]